MLDVFSWCSLRSLLVLGMLIPTVLWGQGARGTINGTVTDATGAVIPGAKVEITNAKTGVVTNNGDRHQRRVLHAEHALRRVQHRRRV